MTYEEKKAWLGRYREAEKKYQRLSYQLAEAQTAARRITQSLSSVPGGSSDGQTLARAVEREEEAERRAYAQLTICDQLFSEIDAVLGQLKNNKAYCALHKYYLNCLAWERVAEEMNFSPRGIFALSRKAIEQLEI